MDHVLSRRQFLLRTALLAAAAGVRIDDLAPRLASAPTTSAADIPTTLLQTIRQGSVIKGSYRGLTTGPGEPYIPRLDVLRTTPDAARTASRRSLLCTGHLGRRAAVPV